MTVIRPNSISGITSLTAHRGSIDFYAHDGSAARFDNINSNVTSGVSTFASLNITGDLDVGGALTYEDVTNIDSVGIITARAGVKVPDGQKIFLGTGDDLQIYHDGSWNYIQSHNSKNFVIQVNDNENAFVAIPDGEVQLYHNNVKKFETTSSGVKVSGSFPDFIIHDTDTTNDNFRILHNSGGTQLQVDPNNVSSGSYLLAAIDGTERLRITSGGDLGLGVNGGMNQAGTFYIQGGQGVRWTHTSDGTLYGDHYVSASGHHVFRTGSGLTERLRITSAGLVGIGEESPDRLLHIKGASSTAYSGGSDTADYNFLKIENTTNDRSAGIFFQIGGNGEAAITATEVADGNTDITFQNRGGGVRSEKLRITSAGNIGINESTPRAKLDVRGTALISDDIGSTLPSTFPASDVQLMVYTSTNGQPITNTNCARILLATDAKQTGPQGYNGAIDFGNSDCTASSQNSQYNYRVASIMSQALADTESNAADGNLEFWTKTSTGSLSQKMGISAEGYVTKSNHPCFDAVRNSGHMSANVYINYNTVKANNGGHYNSSNGRFTAPVAGYYFFSWTSIKNNTNTVTRLYIHKNGTAAYGNRHLRLDAGQDYGDNGTMTAVIQLAANDYVQIYLGAGAVYGVTEEYCIFNGYLLG